MNGQSRQQNDSNKPDNHKSGQAQEGGTRKQESRQGDRDNEQSQKEGQRQGQGQGQGRSGTGDRQADQGDADR